MVRVHKSNDIKLHSFTLFSIVTAVMFFTLSKAAIADEAVKKSDDLKIILGAGSISAPTYLGDDANQISVFPNISVNYRERFKASIRGIEYVVISNSHWQIGPIIKYDFGRNEDSSSPFTLSNDDSSDLEGLGDIGGTLELGAIADYKGGPFVAKLELRKGILGGHSGYLGEASVGLRARTSVFNRLTFISVGPAISFADSSYNSEFFDVSTAQSSKSGISQYDAGAGLNSVGLRFIGIMPLSRKTSLFGFLNYDHLTGDVGDSTIVSERGSKDQIRAGLFFNYSF
ncbi:MAG: MipA/OmpV family protein [Oleibacter sp.]|nr:MipA/OmpV family protein [Thalassolituus sp.]